MDLLMYDSVTLAEIPANAEAVAGYVNGRWPTFVALASRWPASHRVSIAVNDSADADCLDVERFDATNEQALAWYRRQKARGVKRPKFYTSLANAVPLMRTLAAAGIPRAGYGLWTAHYTGQPHRCSPLCGFGLNTTADATQYTNRALGRNLDASLCSIGFFGVTAEARRRALRTWIIAQRAHHVAWAVLKKTSQWKLWRNLGGH